jgi:hypothetical protein
MPVIEHIRLHQARAEQVEGPHAMLIACGLDMRARFELSHWVPAYPLHLMQRGAFKIMTNTYGETGGVCFEKRLIGGRQHERA